MSDAPHRPRIGFIGIGIMGEAMVRRLLDLGFSVRVWNLEPERLQTVIPYGAVPAVSPAEVAASSDILMLHPRRGWGCCGRARSFACD
jgi:3-hydroxyisobutyrate dehydrogenase